MLQIYNTLTRKKEPFTPIVENKVGLYVCGITVYDLCHMGHARTYLSFDIMVRYLRHAGYDVNYVRAIAEAEGATIVSICAAIESDIAELDEAEKAEFMADFDLTEPGLNRVIRAGYSLLTLETYFTAGVKEVRAWTYAIGSTAPQGAGKIHTDFEKGFIRAEIIAYEDFISCKGEAGAKDAGKWRLEGKDYVIRDGDVIHFRFNV